jgi:AbrB family looped-hinge helix DNA binding protein
MSSGNTVQSAAVSRIGQGRQVVIPKRVFDALKLRAGDFVEVSAEAGRLQLRPKRLVDIGDDALTANGSVMVRRGEAEIKSGRSKAWQKVKDERAEAPIARPETGRTTAKRRLGILETPGFVLSEKFNEPPPEEPS